MPGVSYLSKTLTRAQLYQYSVNEFADTSYLKIIQPEYVHFISIHSFSFTWNTKGDVLKNLYIALFHTVPVNGDQGLLRPWHQTDIKELAALKAVC